MSKVYEALKRAEQERQVNAGEIQSEDPDPSLKLDLTPPGPTTRPVLPVGVEEIKPPRFGWLRRSLGRNGDGPALVVGDEPDVRASEQFQVLRTRVQNWIQDNQKRILMISSALSGEGKSFVAANLSISLARIGVPVLLVDADFRTPSLHQPFKISPLRGLIGYLAEKAEFEACVYKTAVPNLSLVPAGGIAAVAPELLAGERMRHFLDHARAMEPAPCVLIDVPATLAVPESQVLANLVDALILVVSANRTQRAAVTRTLDMLKDVALLGLVMNRFETPYSSRIGRDGYGYYYGLSKSVK